MVFVESLDAFTESAEAIYKANPLKTRYVIKYTHTKGKLTLKVTDDRTTVQYKTDQQSDLRKIEKLNGRFMHMMATGEDPPEEEVAEMSQQSQQQPRQRKQQPQEQGGRSKKTRRKG